MILFFEKNKKWNEGKSPHSISIPSYPTILLSYL